MEKTLPLLIALLLAGCSTRVEISTERPAPGDFRAVEKFHTNVAVELLRDQKEAPRPPSPPEQPPTPPETEGKTVEVAGVANSAIIVHGDLYVHEHYHEHLHLDNRTPQGPPAPNRLEKMPERVEIVVHRPRLDPECERLRREHQERVREWKALMNR
jgi:hypothetical protein